jgi:hypothetical protein
LINDLLLLAEAENLPRSRSPGTVLMAPSIAQRSLLETNLPWMVAAAVLLGSTLWMQSVQSLSSSFPIPSPIFETAKEPIAGSTQTTETQNSATSPNAVPETKPSTLNSIGDTFKSPVTKSPVTASSRVSPNSTRESDTAVVNPRGLPQLDITAPEEFTPEVASTVESDLTGSGSPKSISTLVVSNRLPTGIDRQAWASSLADAIRRAEVETEIRTIEIVGRVQVDSSVRVARSDLMIRSGTLAGVIPGQSSRATIEFAPSLLARLQPGQSLIEVASQSLQCLDLNFDVSIGSDMPTREVSIFGLGSRGKIDLDGCRITVKGTPLSFNAAIVTVTDSRRRGSGGLQPRSFDDRVKVEPLEPSSVVLKNSVIRGDASLFKVTASQRIEIETKQVLIGLTGFAIDITGTDGDDRMPPVMRMYCQNTTFATAEGFARILYRQDSAPSLAVNRNSKNCVYWSAPGKPHFLVEGVQRPKDLDDLMHLQGGENAYEAKAELLCKCITREEAEVPIQFLGTEAAWFQEYGNEWSISWQSPVPQIAELYQLNVEDFGLRSGMFMPGYEPATLSPTLVD